LSISINILKFCTYNDFGLLILVISIFVLIMSKKCVISTIILSTKISTFKNSLFVFCINEETKSKNKTNQNQIVMQVWYL